MHVCVCVCVCVCVYVCVCVCLHMCLPQMLLMSRSMIWTAYYWLNKFYFYMAAVVIISRDGLKIKAHYRN